MIRPAECDKLPTVESPGDVQPSSDAFQGQLQRLDSVDSNGVKPPFLLKAHQPERASKRDVVLRH